MNIKRLLVGLGMTAVSIAVIFFVVKKFAPPVVQDAFRV